MHGRWLTLPLAVAAALVALATFAQSSDASIGVGVQVSPVRLETLAHRGESYSASARVCRQHGDTGRSDKCAC